MHQPQITIATRIQCSFSAMRWCPLDREGFQETAPLTILSLEEHFLFFDKMCSTPCHPQPNSQHHQTSL